VFQEVGKFVAPLRETTDTLAERTHLADLKTNVPDYSDDLRAQVIEWAKTQPEYLQGAFNQVIQQERLTRLKISSSVTGGHRAGGYGSASSETRREEGQRAVRSGQASGRSPGTSRVQAFGSTKRRVNRRISTTPGAVRHLEGLNLGF
jgi:hypothetical protein